MVDGYEGFPERDLLSQLCHGAIEMFDLKKEKVVLSSEGLYTRCGFTTPGGQFWIHADYDRQKGKDGRVGGYVTFNNPTKPAAVAKGDFHHLEDHLVPKYGYLACASASEPSGLSYRKHHPTGEVNPHVALLAKFKYQYVGLQQILDYLKVVASAAGSTSRPDFHVWLMQAKPGVTKVQAMYRGCLDDRVLKQSGLDGAFTGVDFSYTVFRNVTLGNLRQAKLIGCTFLQCKATGDALSGADLSLSKVDQCDFQGLRGVITLNYGLLARTTFGGCTFTVTSFNGNIFQSYLAPNLSSCFFMIVISFI